ncbi:MAG: phosphorylcholine transferase LicD [Candidatus Coproplasma sp.]
MRVIALDELKQLQLQILDVVADFCKKNSINYWLDCGTLIGAIRHKGYIPWDDDIDIGMLRPDYDRFLELFNKQSDIYKVYSVENNSQFLYPFAKVLDTSTVLYEPDEKGLKLCVNIDVFVYDNAPEDDKALTKMYKKRDFYRGLHNIRARMFTGFTKGFKKAIKWAMYPFLCLFPKNYFAKKMVENSKKYKDSQTKRIGNFTSITKICCSKELFSEFIPVEFEGKLYNAPIGYDLWLKTFYGDYMVLPPEEKRKPHHCFKAFMLEKGDLK